MKMKEARHTADDIAAQFLRDNIDRVLGECDMRGITPENAVMVMDEYRRMIDFLSRHGKPVKTVVRRY
jgi:hypothetical protein